MPSLTRKPATLFAVGALVTVALLGPLGSSPARANPVGHVKVIVERVDAIVTDDPESDDYYAMVRFANGPWQDNRSDYIDDDNHIAPNWEFTTPDPIELAASIPISIAIQDYEGFVSDDRIDISSDDDGGASLDIELTFSPCRFVAEGGVLTGECGDTAVTRGQGDRPGSAEVAFRVEVLPPASVPGLNVTCSHSPVWPRDGDPITINATSLDGSGLMPNTRTADSVEIWVNSRTAPQSTQGSATSHSVTVGPFSGDSTFAYACKVIDEGGDIEVSTGWRTVGLRQPGPEENFWEPVVLTGPSSSRIDIVFIDDVDDYTGVEDPNFLSDVGVAMFGGTAPGRNEGFLNEPAFLPHQDLFNFWVAAGGRGGDARDDCETEVDVGRTFQWADAAAVLHRQPISVIRDCHPGGQNFFSSNVDNSGNPSARVLLHEAGHEPFNLADEYCCDGGYFQTDRMPNVYADPQSNCERDVSDLPGRTTADCRGWRETDVAWYEDIDDWWTSDPPIDDDIMVFNGTYQLLDLRRIDWVMGHCRSAGCSSLGE